MIETKYGLKYSFPHTLVHIVDNSAYAGELPVNTSNDPSLYSTIVVTGMPMGVDRQVVTITRSDVLNKAFGVESLTNADITKYGQAVEYPTSLINQGVPVKLIRVTPEDASYGVVVLYIEWRIENNIMEIRLNQAPLDDLIAEGIDLAAYANPDRVAKATFAKLASSSVSGGWRREVLMTYVSAGRGSAYNNFTVYINKASFDQMKKYDNAVYNFGTIDKRTSSVLNNEVEQFTASLINDATKLSAYGVVTSIDTVNVQMKKRLEGSSIMIPYVNEQAVRIIYNDWINLYDVNLSTDQTSSANALKAYENIRKTMSVNKFDCIYGKTVYNDNEVNLPYLIIDTIDSEIPKLDNSHIIVTDKYTNQTIPDYENLNTIYDEKINKYFAAMYNITDADFQKSTIVNPGTVFLVNPDTNPVFNLVHTVNPYTGGIGTVRLPKARNVMKNDNVVEIAKITRHNQVQDGASWVDDENNPTTIIYDSAPIEKYFYYTKRVTKPETTEIIKLINSQIDPATCGFRGTSAVNTSYNWHEGTTDTGSGNTYGTVIAVGYVNTYGVKVFKLYQVDGWSATEGVQSLLVYPDNIYACIDYLSYTGREKIYDIIALKTYATDVANKTMSPVGIMTTKFEDIPDTGAFSKIGALYIDDNPANKAPGGAAEIQWYSQLVRVIENIWTSTASGSSDVITNMLTASLGGRHNSRVGTPPATISVYEDLLGETYDVINLTQEHHSSYPTDAELISNVPSDEGYIPRYSVSGTALSSFRVANTNIAVPKNYYINEYGISVSSENGGVVVKGGTTGFFDDASMSSLEFKLRYSELLVQAFRGEIDPRILSPVRVPAKFMFDAGYNTVLSIKQVPYADPDIDDIIYASTIFTDEEKEEFAYNKSLISGKLDYSDIDVKQAMYDLMIERVYNRMPESKRPVGPGSGLQLYLDSGMADINTIKSMNESFKTRFTNPNAVWDIGGYTSTLNGVTYTYTKYIVDHLFTHCNQYTINKPYANTYATIKSNEYTDFFPNIDATDWDLEELLYTSGGNSWVLDINGGLRRNSQRTLYREPTGTSDILQESNMRTLSQLIFLLQNQLDNWKFEYIDDGILASMKESINNIFSGWVGTRVSSLDIQFERDINTDGGEIVVCYVNVTFRGILLRIPVIVNINRRQ